LTDDGGHPVLRRVLLPADYVEPGRSRQGIAPGGEAVLRVYLDSSRARVTSYRLYLFYPA
jgi:HD superfamily phosphohydrolase YqeK